ncbi:thioredoxin domain-containing protein 17 [Biomphalaria pfeifferi]|uniref:Thioredoxin domain-containing protein 17 n=1 Tax=Biomphalaria pfeifferi TaxID=112525 RepID=A0AAD8BYD1_BIOPF|nr:thioredoxin domain-containing protein 17 [Biomphalaria pfeifferi]
MEIFISLNSSSETDNGRLLEETSMKSSNFNMAAWYKESCGSFGRPTGQVETILLPIICACGILGIVPTMIVLSRKTMCTSTNCYLCALAVADLLFLLLVSSKIVVDQLADCRFYMEGSDLVFTVYSVIFMDTFTYLAVGVTVMLAVERYIAICRPMKAMMLCTVKRARIIIVALTVLCFVLSSPRFLDIDVSYVATDNGEQKAVVTWSYLYDSKVYNYIVTGLLLTILPLVILMILNLRLIVEIRRSSKYLQYHLGADTHVRSIVNKEELKITMMLFSVIIAFFVGHAPYMVCSFIYSIIDFDIDNSLIDEDSLKNLITITRTLMALKVSCNFILYCWFSEKFWTTFKRTFCLHHCIPKQMSRMPNGYNNNSHRNVHRTSCYMTKLTTC